MIILLLLNELIYGETKLDKLKEFIQILLFLKLKCVPLFSNCSINANPLITSNFLKSFLDFPIIFCFLEFILNSKSPIPSSLEFYSSKTYDNMNNNLTKNKISMQKTLE